MVFFHSASYRTSTMVNFRKFLYLFDVTSKLQTVKNSHCCRFRQLHEKSGRLNKIKYFVAGEGGNYNCQHFFFFFTNLGLNNIYPLKEF